MVTGKSGREFMQLVHIGLNSVWLPHFISTKQSSFRRAIFT